jgi:AraC family L-rhamnose operon regulatory protein RhaS
MPAHAIHTRRHDVPHLDRCRPQRAAIEEQKIRFFGLARGRYPGRRLPARILPGIRSIGFWDAVGTQDWGLEWHRNDGIEICCLENGTMPFGIADRFVDLSPGDMTVTLPWQEHVLGAPHIGPGRLHWIVLDVGATRPRDRWVWPDWVVLTPRDREALTERLRSLGRPVWRAPRAVVECFHRIARLLQLDRTDEAHSALAIQVNQLLLELLERLRGRPGPADPGASDPGGAIDRTISRFLRQLANDAELLSHGMTVRDMARQCQVGVTTFTECCRRITNTTPIDYLVRCRLELAARLLREQPQRRIVDIALRCGFSSSQHFATRFHERFGVSPSEYRGPHSP